MKITDSADLTGVHFTPEGYLEAAVRISRTGIQDYLGSELGRPDLPRVRVYRGEEAVFDKAALEGFAHIPVTLEHPRGMVNSSNWKDHAVGHTANEILRDGEYLKIGVRVTDAKAVNDVRAGKREVSVGYEAELDWTPGKTPAGELYDCRQVRISPNHLAITAAGRAGSMARIGDSWGAAPIHDHEKEGAAMPTQPVVLGDKAVNVSLEDVAAVEAYKAKVLKDSDAEKEKHEKKIADLEADLAKKDGEIADLKKKQVNDAALDEMVSARTALIGDARKVVKDYDGTGKSAAQIRREVVSASPKFTISDATSEAYIDAAFDILTSEVVADSTPRGPNVRSAMLDAKPASGDHAMWDKALGLDQKKEG